jgi:hypothetical protein
LITRKRCRGLFPGREVNAHGSIKSGKENRNRSSGIDEDKVVSLTVYDGAYGIDRNKLYLEKRMVMESSLTSARTSVNMELPFRQLSVRHLNRNTKRFNHFELKA